MNSLDGFLNIYKEAGWTSHDVVAKVRRLLRKVKVGHAGTLDPQATGVLPICLGKATRLAEFLLHTDKGYSVVMKLGVSTDTQDGEGRVLSRADASRMDRASVERTLQSFVGRIRQVPPMYSAIKLHGQPLYKIARKGQVVDRASREVVVHSVAVTGMQNDEVCFDIVCSRGTYIRTLCADAGARLGVGAHCLRLKRFSCGPFKIEDAVPMDHLEQVVTRGEHPKLICGPEKVLGHLAQLVLRPASIARACHGVSVGTADVQWPPEPFEKGELFRVTAPGIGLIGLARALAGPAEIQGRLRQEPVFKMEKVLWEADQVNRRDYTTV